MWTRSVAAFDDTEITDLIRRARYDDPASVEQLLELHRNYLRLIARNWLDTRLQGKADASDLVQDTLIKAYQYFGEFRGRTEAEMAAWLRQILARNLADLVRRYHVAAARQVSRELAIESALGESSQVLGNLLAGSASTPSRQAQRRELGLVLADAMADLDEDHREVLRLRSLLELDWSEVARRMDRSPNAARMLWTRALARLRPLIEERL